MTYDHDPNAVLDYAIDWSAWLDTGETLTASTWAIAPSGGITQTGAPAASFTAAGVATIWLTGGTAGTLYKVTNHITTSAGRQDDRSITIRPLNR